MSNPNPVLTSPPNNQGFPGLLVPGNIINLFNRPPTKNLDGTYSTIRTASYNLDGKEVLLPTVVDGKYLSDREAVERFLQTGQHLGMFDTPEHADAYATALHNSQASYNQFFGTFRGVASRAKKAKK